MEWLVTLCPMILAKPHQKPPLPAARGASDEAVPAIPVPPEMSRADWESGLLEIALQPAHPPQTAAAGGAPEVPGFEIISLLGTGSSGEVWLAEETEAGRTVALKILRGCGAAGASEEVLQREFRILAKLTHPEPGAALSRHQGVRRPPRAGHGVDRRLAAR